MQLLHFFIEPRFQALRLQSAFGLYFAVLLFGSIPGARAEIGHFAPGLVLHFVTYSVIAVLLFTAMQSNPASRAIKTCLMIAAMGALDEFVQSFLPYRGAAWSDWCIDIAAGCFVASVLWASSPAWLPGAVAEPENLPD